MLSLQDLKHGECYCAYDKFLHKYCIFAFDCLVKEDFVNVKASKLFTTEDNMSNVTRFLDIKLYLLEELFEIKPFPESELDKIIKCFDIFSSSADKILSNCNPFEL